LICGYAPLYALGAEHMIALYGDGFNRQTLADRAHDIITQRGCLESIEGLFVVLIYEGFEWRPVEIRKSVWGYEL
jgi:hypothetical protein